MRTWLTRIGIGVGALVGLLLAALGGVWAYGGRLDSRKVVVPATAKAWVPQAPASPELVARGEHLVKAVGKCVDCHGDDLSGRKFIDDPGLGVIPASNLTRGKGGRLDRYDDVALERLLRHGVKSDGSPALIMPSEEYTNFSDEDLAAVIAYLRSLPPVDHELPRKQLRLVGRGLVTGGVVRYAYDVIDHGRHAPATVPVAATAEYGKYLANVGGCTGCHGPGLSGGKIPGAPPGFKPAANITPTGIGHYTEADFFRALREGIRPGGVPIDSMMPFRLTKLMTDTEIKALYAYLRTVPPKEYGNR